MWLREKRVSTEAICRRDLEMNARRISIEENEMTKEKWKMHRVCKLHSLCNEKNKNPPQKITLRRDQKLPDISMLQSKMKLENSLLHSPSHKKKLPQNKTKQNACIL